MSYCKLPIFFCELVRRLFNSASEALSQKGVKTARLQEITRERQSKRFPSAFGLEILSGAAPTISTIVAEESYGEV